ncbi:hypothetical protein AB0C61_09425 [Streptomyces sp. NPDC048680]|uniref:hypothetical protein n=1 Tax=Streptomyces sp. NPDC048680 TaxID=3155492 RepID=UPI0034129040
MTTPATETLPLSAECALAAQPDCTELHRDCSQTEDIPLPHASGIWLVRRCGCPHHAYNHKRPSLSRTSESAPPDPG